MQVQCGHPNHEGLVDCPTPEDLSDVVLTAPVEINFPLSLESAMAVIDLDSDALAWLRDEWINLKHEPESDGNADVILMQLVEDEKRRIVEGMLREGLTLLQIARYVDATPQEIVTALYGHDRGGRTRNWEGILACDQAYHTLPDDGVYSVIGLAREYGITERQVKRLIDARHTESKVGA